MKKVILLCALLVSSFILSSCSPIVQGAAAQSANLTEWQNSAGNILTEINESGHLHIYGSGEPSDRLIIRGELDSTPTAFIRNDGFSNGVKIRDDDNLINKNGDTYIYIAFADLPFKYANGGFHTQGYHASNNPP